MESTFERNMRDLIAAFQLPPELDWDMFPKEELEGIVPELKIETITDNGRISSTGKIRGFNFLVIQKDDYCFMYVGEDPRRSPLYDAQFPLEALETFDDFTNVFKNLLRKLKPSDCQFEFIGYEVEIDVKTVRSKKTFVPRRTGKKKIYRSWGANAKEAYSKFSEPNKMLIQNGITAQIQKEVFELQDISPQPKSFGSKKYTPNFKFI